MGCRRFEWYRRPDPHSICTLPPSAECFGQQHIGVGPPKADLNLFPSRRQLNILSWRPGVAINDADDRNADVREDIRRCAQDAQRPDDEDDDLTTAYHDEGARLSMRYSYDPDVFACSLFWGGRSESAANLRSAPCWVSERVPLRTAKQR
jgi:hypothetical protein